MRVSGALSIINEGFPGSNIKVGNQYSSLSKPRNPYKVAKDLSGCAPAFIVHNPRIKVSELLLSSDENSELSAL